MFQAQRDRSSILIQLRLEAFPQLLFHVGGLLRLLDLHLYPLSRSEDLALQVETATFLRIVLIEHPLEAGNHGLHVDFAFPGRRHIQYSAGFVDREAPGCQVIASGAADRLGVFCILLTGGCLLIGFGEGATDDSGAGDGNLYDDAVGLGKRSALETRVRGSVRFTICAKTETFQPPLTKDEIGIILSLSKSHSTKPSKSRQ